MSTRFTTDAGILSRLREREKQLGSRKALAAELGIPAKRLCELYSHRLRVGETLAARMRFQRAWVSTGES